jgi:AcrR family transcriptional regulator
VSTAAGVESEKPVGPRSRKGTITRARLLGAAKEIFEQVGYLDARVSDIAERAGVSHGSFYHYFESKEEIFREVAEALQERLSSHSVADSGLLDAGSHAPMWQRIRESNRAYLEGYRDEARIMGVVEQVSRYDQQVGAARFARETYYTSQTAVAIRNLQQLGLVDPVLDPRVAACALSAMVTRCAEMWFVQGLFESDFDTGVDQLTSLCINALQLKDKPRGPRPAESSG